MRVLESYEGQVEGAYKSDVAIWVMDLISKSMNRIDDYITDSKLLELTDSVQSLTKQLEFAKKVYTLVEYGEMLTSEQAYWLADIIAEKVDERCEDLYLCHGMMQLKKLDLMAYPLYAYYMFCRPGTYKMH